MELPHYADDKNQNPMRFLNDLENFFSLHAVPSESKMQVAKQALYGKVQAWYVMLITSEVSYEELKRMFMAEFWCPRKQNKIIARIANGRYNVKEGVSMTEYCIELGRQAKFLDPAIPIAEFIGMVTRHFSAEIRSVIVVTRPTTIVPYYCTFYVFPFLALSFFVNASISKLLASRDVRWRAYVRWRSSPEVL